MTAPTDMALRARYLGAMSHAACTVTVVTTDGAAGRSGVTVSAMASVSADGDKPVLLVCINTASSSADAVITNGVFCVNVLRDDQSYVSDTFASQRKTANGDKFSCAHWVAMGTGSPRLGDPLVAFDCRLVDSKRIGTHQVLFGAVEDVFIAPLGTPLVYANRSYASVQRFHGAPDLDPVVDVPPATLRLGCYQTFAPSLLPELLVRLRKRHAGMRLKLVEGDQRMVLESLRSGETEVALLYDFGLGDDVALTPLGEFSPYVLLAEDHPLTARATLELADLAEEKMVLLDLKPSRDYFLSLFRDAGLTPEIGYRTTSLETLRGLVGQGLGYGLLGTRPWGDQTYDGHRLAIRALAKPALPSRIVLGQIAGRPLTMAAEIFKGECLSLFQT
jgi:flavin reductase (DIM6/NTAB) family NADH-FMN oxidoreductase RutF